MPKRTFDAEADARRRSWMARGRAKVSNPRYGSIVVPCASKMGAIQNAAEFWRIENWLEIRDAEVRAVEPDEGPAYIPRDIQFLIKIKEDRRAATRRSEGNPQTVKKGDLPRPI